MDVVTSLLALSFRSLPGWTSGHAQRTHSAYTTRGAKAIAWTAHGVRYRDAATADPPNRTLGHLPKDGIVVWAVISGGGDQHTDRIRLRLSAARKLPCCEEEAVNGGVYELYGRGAIPGSTMIVRIYFGSRPTTAMRAKAQHALDRLEVS